MTLDVLHAIGANGIVPVVAVDAAADALPLADALSAGGLPVAEITFRTDAAAEVIDQISRSRPDFCVGAGTILSTQDHGAAARAGAHFTVAPGLDRDVVAAARSIGLPHVPGVVTPSEVTAALREGCHHLKLFPAAVFGGVELLAALAGPFAGADVIFMPTGGIRPENAPDYLTAPSVFAVGGTWIAPRDDIRAGRWTEITERAAAAVKLVQAARDSGRPDRRVDGCEQ